MNKYINKKIYFLGIGGISMYAIALFLKKHGAFVYGYDRTRNENTDYLNQNGIEIFYEASLQNSKDADICVCTAAIGKGNEEFDNVVSNGIPIVYRGECLGDIIDHFENSIGVSGTHGKSTTSGMLSEIFLSDKTKNPTILMGAILPSIDSAFKIGDNKDLVFEACEYKDSFLSFRPSIAIILNVSLDHTDYFKDLEQMKNSFVNYAKGADYVVTNYDCKNALECAKKSGKKIITYSISDNNADFYAQNVIRKNGITYFDLCKGDDIVVSLELKVPGAHNLSNALAASAAAIIAGVSLDSISDGLKKYRGIKRRFELLGKVNGASVFDDYAHHPDEIFATLSAASSLDYKKIIVIFQPHTYTRLNYFFESFKSLFSQQYAGKKIKALFLPTYAAREKNNLGYDTEKLAQSIDNSEFIPTLEDASKYIMKNAKDDEMYILMGAGDVTYVSKGLVFDK